MLLLAKYKSGEIRRVTLHPTFFTSYDTSKVITKINTNQIFFYFIFQ